MNPLSATCSTLVSVALTGCTTIVATYDLDEAMKAGNIAAARAAASRGLRVGHDDDRPNRTRSRTEKFLIERGVLAMAERDWNAAALDLRDGESTVDGDEIARWNFVAHHKPRDASWDGYRRGWNDAMKVPWVPKPKSE